MPLGEALLAGTGFSAAASAAACEGGGGGLLPKSVSDVPIILLRTNDDTAKHAWRGRTRTERPVGSELAGKQSGGLCKGGVGGSEWLPA